MDRVEATIIARCMVRETVLEMEARMKEKMLKQRLEDAGKLKTLWEPRKVANDIVDKLMNMLEAKLVVKEILKVIISTVEGRVDVGVMVEDLLEVMFTRVKFVKACGAQDMVGHDDDPIVALESISEVDKMWQGVELLNLAQDVAITNKEMEAVVAQGMVGDTDDQGVAEKSLVEVDRVLGYGRVWHCSVLEMRCHKLTRVWHCSVMTWVGQKLLWIRVKGGPLKRIKILTLLVCAG